jgi:hypothetical protein
MKYTSLLKGMIFASSCLVASAVFAEQASMQLQPPTVTTTVVQKSAVWAHVIKDSQGKAQIEIQVPESATVKVLKDKQVLVTQKIPAGRSFINTDNFPKGKYPINIAIKQENGTVFYLSQNISVAK